MLSAYNYYNNPARSFTLTQGLLFLLLLMSRELGYR